MSESLLEKYPHLKLLTKLKKPAGLPSLPQSLTTTDQGEGQIPSLPTEGRISLLGPGVGSRAPLVPLQQHPPPHSGPPLIPRTKVCAEDLFAASIAADEDQWLQFQVEENVPAKDQLDQLKMWLMANKPSTIARSSRIGWIAVKFKDKGKKVLEAKVAWDSFEGERSMEAVNQLAEDFNVEGGKWLCHLPTGMVDQVWAKLATTLMCGGLGPSVYMVKVSPVEDIHPEQARGEHVLIVYNTNYKDTEQVMRVENLMRSAGVTTVLNYKPDIFSALGIYRNNKWGFRPTIYCSRVMLMEGKSRVETVGTGKWYYNSSKGLQCPVEKKDASNVDDGKEIKNKLHHVKQESVQMKEVKNIEEKSQVTVPELVMGKVDDIKTSIKAPSCPVQLDIRSLDDMKDITLSTVQETGRGNSGFSMDDMEAMKTHTAEVVQASQGKLEKKGIKLKDCSTKVDIEDGDDAGDVETPAQEMYNGKEISLQTKVEDENVGKDVIDVKVTNPVNRAEKKAAVKKPAWLLKLEQLQMKSLDEMSKTS